MKKKYKIALTSTMFLSPFLILYIIFTIFPMAQGMYMSFHKWSIIRKISYVGIGNYQKLLGDSEFWSSLQNTTFFVLFSTPLMIVLALLLALISNRASRFRKLFRISFFLPNVLSVSVISYIAIFVLQPYTGFLNSALHSFGITAEPYWLADEHLAWISIAFTTLWWTVGFNMILFLSALQDIPEEIYEAASLDGASTMKSFWAITLPMLKPITKVILLLQIIASYKIFAQIWIITKGGPGTATRPLIQYIYETGFRKSSLGYAATLSYGLFIILVIITLIQFRVTREREV